MSGKIRNAVANLWTNQYTYFILIGFIIGICAGFSNFIFYSLYNLISSSFLDPLIEKKMVIFGTIVGGLILFFLTYFAKKEDILGYKFHTFIHNVSQGSGLITIKETIIKAFSQIISLGFGGSVGQEGPMAQLGGSIGSIVGQKIRIKKADLKIFIACGIAGAIAATFNAPITGVLFVEEVTLLRNIKIRSFLPVVISAATATVVAGFYSSDNIFYNVDFLLVSYKELLIYALLGVAIGLASSFFTKFHFVIERRFEKIFPEQRIRPLAGGIILGLIAFAPLGIGVDVLGNGTESLKKIFAVEYTLLIAAGILILKPLATSITLSSGWPGGIFAPSIFLGAICGYMFGYGVETLLYSELIDTGDLTTSYAIVGMGTFLAAMTQAPLTSIFFTFEITQTYQAVLPIMVSSVIGTSIYRLIVGRSFESCYFKKDNIELIQNEESNILSNMKVSEIMKRSVVTIPEKMTLGKFIEFLPTTQLTTFPLIDENDNLSGIISVQDYRGWVLEDELRDVVIMKDLASVKVNTVTPEESMLEVLKHWDKGDMLPVVAQPGSKKIIGILSRRDALIAYNKALNEESMEN
ncbi:MAG: chloride channel protein [Thermodesulfobacteriota bacterium]|nr:chloride channel protein [Thermodesulfobacteriota bacterium]MEE2975798.1 chloride channel protein [Thermodesulfobacteriota bacterium]|tara:strand:- start:66731 stop:68470 length:1740 start_codon:yes stop_codon:yes gene_type:complete